MVAVLVLASFAGVATRRRTSGVPVWSAETLLYTLAAAVLTTVLLKVLHIFPWP
jgi:hypothetical protein